MNESKPNSHVQNESKPKTLPIQEVEHDNLLLGQKLIEVYEQRIALLEEENRDLRSKLTSIPLPITHIPIRRVIRTTSELRDILESRSSKSL
jgi:hypothetical protein